MTATEKTNDQLLQELANAYATYQQCSGHSKAFRNEMKVNECKGELNRRKVAYPSDIELGEIGKFNGQGSY